MTETTTMEESAAPASIEKIRAHFPALARMHEGFPVAYFDGPGGTQVPREVADAVADYLLSHNGNTHWAFPTSLETNAMITEAREAVADFLNASPHEIAFGANMTTLTFHLARSLGRNFCAGDEIVITELDHHANVAPWRALEKERGVVVRVAKMVPQTGQLDWEHFEKQLSAKTKLVAIGAASNALGTVTDVRRAGEMAHSLGAQIFVDAVHYAPHSLVDVRALDCDYLACSAYKFYGPHVGILFGKRELLDALDVPKLIPAPDAAPEKIETGTQNHEGIAGVAAAIEFLASLGSGSTRRKKLNDCFAAMHGHTARLFQQLREGLTTTNGVSVFGPPPDALRTPTIAFTIDGKSSADAARQLASKGAFVSHGDFYATTVVERLGQSADGLLRAGCACYTTEEEVDRLIDAVKKLASEAAA